MSEKKRFNIAVIGGGLTATAMLCQFVNRVKENARKQLLDPSKIEIQIYEKILTAMSSMHAGRKNLWRKILQHWQGI